MSRFKILVFLFAISLLASLIGVTYWISTRVIGQDNQLETQIQKIQTDSKKAPPDPGIRRFEKAIESIQAGELEQGRRALYELLHSFPNSTCALEAKRIIGEINMDMLFSINDNPAKKNHIVQPGESLGVIARKNQTTIESILRANGMLSTTLQPGDHLFVFPLEFEIVVNLTHKTVTLLKNDRLFKVYHAEDIKLPPGVRAPSETVVKDKAAWVNGKRVLTTDSSFNASDKWLMFQRPGFNLRAMPEAKSVVATPAPASTSSNPTKNKRNSKDSTTETPEVPEEPSAETGIFLLKEDIEELFTIIRQGTVAKIER